jgi:tripartite-type tricarboxylate transporter receptor subunit TctC
MTLRSHAVLWTFAAILLGPQLAVAQPADYPTKSVRFIVPWPPGGPADIIARAMTPGLSDRLGHPVFIDNRGGGNGNIGADALARSAPDGYTIGLVAQTHAANASLYRNLSYDMVKDFAPIASMLTTPYFLVVHPSLPAHSVADLIALAKAKPGKLTYGSAGSGGGAHVATELFKSMAKIDILHVSYKGTAPALVDVMAGRVNLMFAGAAGTLNQVQAGRLRVLGMTGAARSPSYPDIPTIAESGVPGYAFASWFGVVAPAGTPKPIIERLNADIAHAMKTPRMAERLAADASELLLMSPQQFGEFIPKQIVEWRELIRLSGSKIE